MHHVQQSPTDPAFVQNPYPTYTKWREMGPLVWWDDYAMPVATTHAAVHALLRDKTFGREMPADLRAPIPDHLTAFYQIEDNSMLELEPPRHSRLRQLVLRAFTSRRVQQLAPEILTLADTLIDAFPSGPFDLLSSFAQPLPVIVIARLLGVPEADAPQLLHWSNTMVKMYQAGRTHADEVAANTSTQEFTLYLRDHIAHRRQHPADDLLTALIAARDDSQSLSEDEMIATAVLLLNAGHEATAHSTGNALATLLDCGFPPITPELVEETLRYDPPLHLFTRIAQKQTEVFGHRFEPGQMVGLMLASANRDAAAWPRADQFDGTRTGGKTASFGGGIHFCLGAPLARQELLISLGRLRERCPELRLTAAPHYADIYHFRGLERLMVRYD